MASPPVRQFGMIGPYPETKIFRGICNYYDDEAERDGSDLKLIGAKIWSWKGNETEVLDPASGGNLPASSQLPVIRITPVSLPMSWMSEGSFRGDWNIQFEIFSPKTCMDDLTDMAGAVRTVLFPTDPVRVADVRAKLSFAELIRPKWSQQLGGVGLLGPGDSRFGLRAVTNLIVIVRIKVWGGPPGP
jgi:hypothetical protein